MALKYATKFFYRSFLTLIRALRKLAEDNLSKFPIGARVILNNFYVDDLVTGADSLQEALAIKIEISQLLQEGQFELRKWASNDPVLQSSQSSIRQKECILSCDKESETQILGLVWNCGSDQFKFSNLNCLPHLTTPTKRNILTRISLIFDPLGLLGPSTLITKIIMQDLWRLRIGWNESLPLDVNTKWKRYEAELSALNNISLPPQVIAVDEYTTLWSFMDFPTPVNLLLGHVFTCVLPLLMGNILHFYFVLRIG